MPETFADRQVRKAEGRAESAAQDRIAALEDRLSLAQVLLKAYLDRTMVQMGSGGFSSQICSLCQGNFIPARGADPTCPCNPAREFVASA